MKITITNELILEIQTLIVLKSNKYILYTPVISVINLSFTTMNKFHNNTRMSFYNG